MAHFIIRPAKRREIERRCAKYQKEAARHYRCFVQFGHLDIVTANHHRTCAASYHRLAYGLLLRLINHKE